MGKLLILSIPDHEEHIINKIMELIADSFSRISRPGKESADCGGDGARWINSGSSAISSILP